MTIRDLIRACTILAVLLAALLGGGLTVSSEDEDEDSEDGLFDMLRDGEVSVNLRYRYEHVSEDAFGSSAEASTLRTSLSYWTAWYRGFRGVVEFEDVADLGLGDDHDSLRNGVADRPVIADPRTTEVHRVLLLYGGDEETNLRIGRQEILLDDQRFVGNVGWRQNRQSFDAVKVTAESVPRTALTYAYVGNANVVTGTNRRTNAHLLNAKVDLKRFGAATAYYYYIDFDSAGLAGLSSSTLGASWNHEQRVAGLRMPLHVQLARQNDTGDNPGTIDAGYGRVEVGLMSFHKKLQAKAGYEVLEGSVDDGQFNTPFATLHGFNGWADKFLVTPANGLEDLYFSFRFMSLWTRTAVTLHRFEADTGGADYGDEIDVLFEYWGPWDSTFALKYANYDADGFSSDTEKFWAYVTLQF